MKKVWTMLIGIALGAMVLCGAGCKNSVRYDRYNDANRYKVGAASFTGAQVTKVEIDWLGGSVEVEQNAVDKVVAVEEGDIEKEDERMRYYLDGATLKIQYCASGLRVQEAEKNLHVSVPAGLSLEIDCTSARVNVLDTLEVANFSVETTSGNLEAERIRCAGEVDLETVSGNIKINELTAETLSAETTSGGISVEKLSAVNMDVDTTSGGVYFGLHSASVGEIETNSASVKIKLLNGIGGAFTYSTFSGEVQTQRSYVKTGKTYTFSATEGTSACNLGVETLSGNLIVE